MVFVVRTISHSFLSRAGTLTYVAFVVAQVRRGPSVGGVGAAAMHVHNLASCM